MEVDEVIELDGSTPQVVLVLEEGEIYQGEEVVVSQTQQASGEGEGFPSIDFEKVPKTQPTLQGVVLVGADPYREILGRGGGLGSGNLYSRNLGMHYVPDKEAERGCG